MNEENHELHRATHKGSLDISGIKIECYVLDDGTRILSQRGLYKALALTRGGRGKGGDRMRDFLENEKLKDFYANYLEVAPKLTPFKFLTDTGMQADGYPAILLPEVCDAVVQAWKNERLLKRQKVVADHCEILLRGFARVGIIALVDEATGYQYDRERDELQVILKAYVRSELLPWASTFPDEYYREMFRLRNWPYDPKSTKRPSVIGKWTNRFIYENLPEGVLKKLQESNPKVYNRPSGRRHKNFQFLTEDIGEPHLRGLLQQIIILMRISTNWRKFLANYRRAFPDRQTELQGEGFDVPETEDE